MNKNLSQLCRRAALLGWAVMLTACGTVQSGPDSSPIASASIADIVSRYRQQIPERMRQANVPGLAIVVVDDKDVLWSEGFGYTDWDRRTRVTPDTLFSIQSMSKSFAATAVMFAAQDGLVDLDAPISTYLPEFRVNSIFEEHPEHKITLRILLSHTSGLVHEGPVGGNSDLPGATFEAHIAAISSTWLKFPVGTRWSYSNLGIDLAGYIVQVRTGLPYARYVQDKIFTPLGMTGSLIDSNRVRSIANRAIGHDPMPLPPPTEWLLIPSGGVWTTAKDMARYLQFHINEGVVGGNRLLRTDLVETMYTPPNPAALGQYYALGIGEDALQGTRRLEHGGGGFGFNSYMIWYPELKLGAAVLTNAENVDLYHQLTADVLDSIIEANYAKYHEREATADRVQPAYPPLHDVKPLSDVGLAMLIAERALPNDEAAKQRRQSYAGTYVPIKWGLPVQAVDVKIVGGQVIVSGPDVTFTVTEVQPGLFFDAQGQAYTLHGAAVGEPNTTAVHIQSWSPTLYHGVYFVSGLIFVLSILVWPARAIRRRLRARGSQSAPVAEKNKDRMLRWAAIAVVAGSLIGLLCLVAVLLVPNLGYVPWPRPYADLLWWQYAGLSLPSVGLLLAAGLAVLVSLAIARRAGEVATRTYLLVADVTLLIFNLVLIK